MRCAQFQRQAKHSREEVAATVPIKPSPDQPASSASVQPQHQPSDNLSSSTSSLSLSPVVVSSPAAATASCKSAPSTNMIRRSQRESAKIQSQSTSTQSSSANSVVVTKLRSNSNMSTAAACALKSQGLGGAAAAVTRPGSLPQHAGQSESGKTGGGRHPHPPSANNTKLKHKCPFEGCPWRFATPYKLRRHIKSHTKETPYLCKECGRGFSVRYNLLMHIQTIHSQPQKFKCPIRGCKEAFHSQSRLNGHLRRIHKKDWKSLQNAKDNEAKATGTRGSTQGVESSDPSNSSARKPHLSSVTHNCPHCSEQFSSKAKLNAHIKLHAPDKPFKCIVQGCNRCFDSHDKLIRHADSHKNSKQFCCPHRNCNRIFLRQTHLRNHLKIHTQDHHFICPVLDCSQKFASESAYNIHLNSHINYGYSCPYPGCELSFLSRKRLAIHTQVVHQHMLNETGMNSPLLDGIQPHLGLSSLHSPSSASSPSSQAQPLMHPYHTTQRRCVLDKEFIKNVDLPGLSANDIEAVLTENEDWSGEQIDQFLHSAVDLSEIESKLFSMANYESDSGYSTYDVSPITSTAPANLAYSVSQVTTIPPPPLTLINHGSTTSPLYGNPAFTGLPLQPSHPSPSPLIHDADVSPCASDGGFFSSHSNFGSLASTPSQETMPFFPPPPSLPPPPPTQQVSMYQTQSYTTAPPDFTNTVFSLTAGGYPDMTGSSSAEASIPNFSLQIPDIILHDVNNTLPLTGTCPIPPLTSDIKFSSYSHSPVSQGQETPMIESPCLIAAETKSVASSDVKNEYMGNGACSCDELKLDMNCSGLPISMTSPPALTSHVAADRPIPELISNESPLKAATGGEAGENKGEQYPMVTQYRYSKDMNVTISSLPNRKGKNGVSKSSKTAMKGMQKKKTQWPRSMNRANLIAFREHILNRLKKAQESGSTANGQVIPIQVLSNKATAGNGDADGAPNSVPAALPIKASPPNSSACEVQVKYERNHLTPPKRCHSEPANLESMVAGVTATATLGLQNSHSDSDISVLKLTGLGGSCVEEMKLLAMGQEGADLLSELNFNPDTFLAPNEDRRMLNDLELKFSMENSEDEAGEILDLFDEDNKHHYASTSSLSDVENMDMNCIHNLLDTSKPPQTTFSDSPSPLGHSPLGSPPLLTPASSGNHTPLVSDATPMNLSRSNSLGSVIDSAPATDMPRVKAEGVATTPGSFKFPEILSIQGSMVLDGVSMLGGDEGEAPASYQAKHTFLQSHHDPLLADGHSSHSTAVDLFDF